MKVALFYVVIHSIGATFSMTRIHLLISFTCLILLVGGVHANTLVGGQITRATWTKLGEPWEVTSPCTLASGRSLTIEAGVRVLMHSGTGINVLGVLHVRGTPVDSVYFLPEGSGQWSGISVSGGDSSSFAYTRLSGCQFNGTGGALRVSKLGTRVYLANCVIRDNVADIGGGLHIHTGARAVLQTCTISRNHARGAGGGIEINGASAFLRNCTISRNTTRWGGGVEIINSEVRLEDCTISQNNVGDRGGGASVSTPPLSGGKPSKATFVRCTIEGNTANGGAGIYVSGVAEATLDSCTLTANSAAGDGGGIFVSGSDVLLQGCIVSHNEAFFGGAISARSAAGVVAKRCLLTSNGASNGGMIYGENRSVIALEACTVVSNVAQSDGGAVYLMGGSSVTTRSSILWDNVPCEVFNHPTNPGTIEYAYSCVCSETVVIGPGNIANDPMFTNTAFGDYTLLRGSPCIDTGDPAAPIDKDGSRADMGAIPYTHPVIELPPPSDMAINAGPNPFHATTLIRLTLPISGSARAVLYDIRGVRVRTMIHRKLTAGTHIVTWDGRDETGRQCASGVYLIHLVATSRSATTRLTLVR
jgi:parallel beta helix pectate lyase-like protein/flagellar hook capping protein FlgD